MVKNSLEFEKRFALILIIGCLWLTRGLSTLGMKADKQLAISLPVLGYLKDSNAAAHSVDTGISYAVRLKRIKNDIECPIYMLESTRIITIPL